MDNHGRSTDTKPLSTSMAKCEAVENCCLLKVQTLNDINSPPPLSPVNILTMKSNVIFSPPNACIKPDLFSK